MTTTELEQFIESQAEAQNLDFKADMAWDVKKFAKDILAMSNVRDGGFIIIGVIEKDNRFVGTGCVEATLKSYKVDEMKDQLLRYADPAVDIRVNFPKDSAGRDYVVIKIFSFREVPVISKIEIPGELKAHTIYYRNTDKRVQSAAVSNANDLRDIVEAATVRMMQRRKQFGFIVAPSEEELLNKELNTLPTEGALITIKSRGYWEISFKPNAPGTISSTNECINLIERSKVSLNWTFPWIPKNQAEDDRIYPADGFIQVASEIGSRKEFWRLYQSEQFVDFKALPEDWYDIDNRFSTVAQQYPSGTSLTFYTSAVYLITEVYTFLERLMESKLYKEGVEVSLILHRAANRTLRVDNHERRHDFLIPKTTIAPTIQLGGNYSVEDILENSTTIATEMVLKLFDAFGFSAPPDSILIEQRRYLNGH
jgi:hypothetical protein